VGVDGLAWRKKLLAWEVEQVGECISLLGEFVLQDNVSGKWIWKYEHVKGYSVKGVCHLSTRVKRHIHAPVPFVLLILSFELL